MKSLLPIALACVLLLAAAPPAAAQTWNFQIVDDAGDVGYYSRIVVTSDGTPHILYMTSTGVLKLARWIATGPAEGGWNLRTIDTGCSTGHSCALAVDSDDKLHMAWSTGYAININYAMYDPASETFIISEEHIINEAGSVDLALFETGGVVTPTVAWVGLSKLKVASRDPGTGAWTIAIAYDNATVSGQPSIAADSNGALHVSFHEYTGANLMYATNANVSGTWISEYVDIAGSVGTPSSIVLDTGDVPYIVYYDATNGDLKYAKLVTP